MKYHLIIFLLLQAGLTSMLFSQTMIVKTSAGDESSFELSAIGSCLVINNSFQVNMANSASESFTIAEISKIYFNTPWTEINEYTSETNPEHVVLYPNPARDYFNLANVSESTTVSIYRIDGVLVYKETITSTNPVVEVSQLSRGIYVVKVNNQVIRFNKL